MPAMKNKQRIAILGASGYTGAELIRLLLLHPHVEICALTADSQAGKSLHEVYPHLGFTGLPALTLLNAVDYSNIDLVFCCLPHGTTQEVIAALPPKLKVIDLSADFRLADVETYAKWYGHEHRAPKLQKEAVYGLTEVNREKIKTARLVANPGCYPTSVQLPLVPLLAAGLIEERDIIIDAKSGVTGAGRSLRQSLLFTEVNDGFAAYSVGAHRHAPEIEQGLSLAVGAPITVSFTPHLVPMNRGILSTMYVSLARHKTADDLVEKLKETYAGEPFVKIMPKGAAPGTHMVRGTNFCFISVFADRLQGRAIIISAIDNLTKGASGQAVQNMNVMYGFPETTALEQTAVFP
jgi:N-acetyl-gamma-glutamyl-phosphate reductase